MIYAFLPAGETLTLFVPSVDICQNDPAECRCLWHVGKRVEAHRPALAAAARQSGDAKQAPSEGPQSGGEAVTHNLKGSNPTETGE